MRRPSASRRSGHKNQQPRVNGKIRARQVRLVAMDGRQMGIYKLADALDLARSQEVDLVEVAPNASPPVCRLINFGKYRYEQAKKEKESKKHHHANKIKEIQLSPVIDPHDFEVKTAHAADFLCEEMKVKAVLRFKGRQMAHKEVGEKVVRTFIEALKPYGVPEAAPRMVGRAMNVVLSPLPRQKRAPNPRGIEVGETSHPSDKEQKQGAASSDKESKGHQERVDTEGANHQLNHNPLADIEGQMTAGSEEQLSEEQV